jgi:antitoxin PrlF
VTNLELPERDGGKQYDLGVAGRSATGRLQIDYGGMNSYLMSMKSVVSEKGQVTIPKRVRDTLGLKPGTVLQFEAVEGRLVGRKALREDVFAKWRGKGKVPAATVDAYLTLVRDANRR